FMFPGGSAQYVGMAKEIYQNEPVFRQSVDQCTEMLEPELGLNLCQFMYPSDEDIERAKQELKRTLYGLPALFIVEYALAKLWLSWGVKPEAMIGHSLGEYVAAHISGVFSLEDALKLVLLRGRLFERLPEGAMLSVALTEEEARQVPIEGLSIAAVNGSSLSVLSGAVDAIERAEKYLEKLEPKRLHISVAAHSAMVEPILDEFQAFFEKLSLSSPKIPFISNVTGSWIKDSEAVDPEYWRKHLRQTVKFAEGIEELLKGTGRIFLEVGPGTTLTTLSSQFLTQRQDSAAISSLPHHLDQRSDEEFLLNALGQLWLEGISIDWPKLYEGEKRLRLPLPTYPFQRQRYWVEPCEVEELERVSLQKSDKKRKLKSREELSNWFYLPNWKQTPLTTQPLNNPEILFLIFVDRLGFGDRVAESLEAQGYKTLLVKIGERFEQLDKRRYLIDPKSKQDYENLMQDSGLLKKSLRILHFWNVTEQAPSIEEAKWLGFYSMLFLAQAIGDGIEEAKIYLISNGLQAVSSEEVVHPSKATLLGSCKVIPQEYQNLKCSSIDITNFEDRFIEPLIDEFLSEEFGNEITYRAALRYQKTYEPFKIPETTNSKVLRYEGVYLITGGLGGIALTLAEYLARNLKAKLILVGRSSLPPKSLWQEQDYSKEQSEKIAKLKLLEELGAEVLALSADVADKEQMQEVLQQAKEQFGTINGVIHTAGVPVGGLVQLKTVEAADRVMRAKVDGTMVLDELLKDESIDFLLLCSSLNSILGGFGHVAYAAANAFLDSYAQSRNLKIGWTVSVNWDTWQE
ncbi:MAG: SDR family NAD(P)-dependent oxidoreductase, partial [Blastocatellia bacterium]|nr:SDR family NAD(P)-dependent oxidoreductase [Blastocatellia bacterium]